MPHKCIQGFLMFDHERESVRVREIIRHLDYDLLVKKRFIPDNLFNSKIPKGKYPPMVCGKGKQRDCSSFGMFMDEISQEMCLDDKKWKDKVYPFYLENHKHHQDLPTEKEIMGFMGFFTNTSKFLNNELVPFSPKFRGEIECEGVVGHPDVLTEEFILDFKTTGDFSKMRKETILQLLAYHAIALCNGEARQSIGVVLLLQRKIITETLDGVEYDAAEFMKLLCNTVPKVQSNRLSFLLLNAALHSGEIGHHMSKSNFLKILNSKDGFPSAIQIFTRSPRGNGDTQSFSDSEIKTFGEIIRERDIRLYIHAPYWINLSHKRTTEGRPSSINVLREELDVARRLGARGVVVHVGKSLNSSIEKATKAMYDGIIECLEDATEECPLLLETAAGQGTEILYKMKDLLNFYKRFSKDQRKRFKLCFDSCHVFASGYDPFACISVWLKHLPGSIALIHFNGSMGVRGCRVDRHSYFDDKLLAIRLAKVFLLANENGIPMVRE